MNKFTILASAALLGLFSACSSDEPSQGNGGNTVQSPSALLRVNIQSADLGSRADNAIGAEGDYEFGNESEHEITTGNFFFFDASEVYVAQADVWNGGGGNKPTNIEYIGNQILVLKGLSEQNAPKYMVTVLNYNALANKMIAGVTTLTEFRNEVVNYTAQQNKDGKDLLVMTTTSFEKEDGSKIIGVTELTDGNLVPYDSKMTDAEVVEEVNKQAPVDVYVERLAAKYTFDSSKKNFTVTLTLAGSENDENGTNNDVARTTLGVTINGFGIVNEADKSYLVKNMVTPSDWTNWNKAADHRCFWAKSVYYDNTDATGLVATKKVAKVSDNKGFEALYSNENTKPYASLKLTGANNGNRVNAKLITNVVFTATVTVDGKAKSLVEYNGIYYLEDQFKAYILKRLQETNLLNYYKKVVDATSETLEVDNKTIFMVNGAKYKQVGVEDLDKARFYEDKTKAELKYVYRGADEDLYAKSTSGETTSFTKIENGVVNLNEALKGAVSSNGHGTATLFEGGNTYYVVPIEHLLENTDYVVDKDGQYGIVRNHWYNFTVDTISKLGHGVYDPSDGEDSDVIEITEDPKDPKVFGMSANVNLLSWKIVKQSIKL